MAGLFSEFNIRGFKIKNRIVMPPVVTFDYGREDGKVTDEHVMHYGKKAADGAGMIITEAACVNPGGRLAGIQLRLWSDEFIEGFSRIAGECHKYGTVVLAQIHHAGLKTPRKLSDDIVSPSGYTGPAGGAGSARSLKQDEIRRLREDFINAALRAKKAGFDGIELHGAHGYLLNQFVSPGINKREDLYGGSVKNRARFTVEIIKGIREATGEHFIIDCRMGCNDPDLKTSIETAKEFEKAGADILHVSFGMTGYYKPGSPEEPKVPAGFNYNWIVYGGTQIKSNVNIPVTAVNCIRTPERANYLLENNLADFTGILRGLLVDDDWIGKARRREKVKECLNCRICSWFRSGKECPGKKAV